MYDKGRAGTVVDTETILAEKGGDIYTKAVGSAFFVGQGNWGGPKGEDCALGRSGSLGLTEEKVQVRSITPRQRGKPQMPCIHCRQQRSLHTCTGKTHPALMVTKQAEYLD